MLRFDHITLHYGSQTILDDLSFEIGEGQFAVVIGPSGCGKTTTLKLVNRLIQPDSGHIYLNGQDIAEVDRVSLRRHTGYVIQQIGLFPNMTVHQNISVVPKLLKYSKEEQDRIVHELLELVGMPYDQYAFKYPSQMSGGQQQRVAIARALVNNPVMILADEATGNLDTRTSFEILTLFQRLHTEGSTIVFVTHNPEIAQFSSRNIVLRDGHITDDVRNGNIQSAQAVLDTIPVDNGM